jgi:hypothetical protein
MGSGEVCWASRDIQSWVKALAELNTGRQTPSSQVILLFLAFDITRRERNDYVSLFTHRERVRNAA